MPEENAGVLSTPLQLARPEAEWPPVRCCPSLQAPQGPLVDFLTSGYGYDEESVGAAVRLGNEHFGRRELPRAVDFYGAAYEIGRLHFDYKPLMHDLILRRVICYSMLGDLQKALSEADLALRVIPNSAVVIMYRGLIHAKLGDADEANRNFQYAVALCRELRDLVDSLVAFFMLAQGHCDRAIQICTQVLQRQPKYAAGLLVRGDAYKFHPSGYFSRQAADDYTTLMDIDPELQPLLGDLMTPQQHARFDELVLRFHPRLKYQGPRLYTEYPMCTEMRKHRPFLVAALVFYFVGKLKTCVRSTLLVQNVERRNEELLQARAAAEQKVRNLVATQQRLAAVESSAFSEVWGPADPDHSHVRRYRRYWMERPLGFPKRPPQEDDDGSPPPPLNLDPTPEMLRQASNRSSVGMDPNGANGGDRAAEGERGEEAAWEWHALSPLTRLPPEASPATLFLGPVASPDMKSKEIRQESEELGHSAADVLLETPAVSDEPHPTAKKLSSEGRYAKRPPIQKLGTDWNDSQWLNKALELAATFSKMEGLPKDADVAQPVGKAVPQPPACNAWLRVQAAAGEDAEQQVNLADAMEKQTFDVLHDWFTPLDRIYEVCDMGPFHVEPEALVAASGMAGAPGHSYVVPRQRPRPRSATPRLNMGGGGYNVPMRTEEAMQYSDSFLKRYQGRLINTSLPPMG